MFGWYTPGVLRKLAFAVLAALPLSFAQQSSIWVPAAQVNWQWQLTKPVDTTVNADVYDIDLFDNEKSVVEALHAQGRKAICYVSVGTWEPWRPDAGSFPESVKGKAVDGFATEKWLDIRNIAVLGPIMQARLELCKLKGFDGVEPDNVDGYTNKSGFPLTAADQLAYNKYLAREAHNRGLSVGLKNDLDQIPQLLADFDWALNEQCFEYKECGAYTAFTQAGKAVFQVEYNLKPDQFCSTANSMNFNSIEKDIGLDAFRVACRTVASSTPSITAITNSASYGTGGVSPNEIVVIFGTSIGPAAVTSAASINWPQSLAGTQVLFDGTPAQLLYVSAGQISAVVPWSVAGKGTTAVSVDRGSGVVSAAVQVPVVAAAPALFTINTQGTGPAAAVNQDGTVNGASNPASRGSYMSLFATGISGSDVKVTIEGQNATVTYAGGVAWSGPGLTQINVIVPAGVAGGTAQVVVQSAGFSSRDGVTLAVAP
jgi:uncharacterized protein (TIGR03437 family)